MKRIKKYAKNETMKMSLLLSAETIIKVKIKKNVNLYKEDRNLLNLKIYVIV
jgi:hypothetical protein